MLNAYICLEQKECCSVALTEVAAHLADPKTRLWIEGNDLTEEEWTFLATNFPFHPLALEDARQQGQRPKVDVYDSYLFASLRYWSLSEQKTVELDIFLGKNYLIVLQEALEYEVANAKNSDSPIQTTRTRWEKHPDRLPHEMAFLFYILLDATVDTYFPVLDQIADEIEDLETAIYDVSNQVDITDALRLKKRLMVIRQSMTPLARHREPTATFGRGYTA